MNARPTSKRQATAVSGEFLEGRDLWHQINKRLGDKTGRVAAIAYLGVDAPSLLHGWGEGDLIVCNASEKALRSGSTNPDALKQFIDNGVEVRSSGALHAKVIASRTVAIVGSMNASKTSTTTLIETAVATRDRATIAKVAKFVRSLRKASLLVDRKFLTQARKSYRPPRAGGGGGSVVGTAPRVHYTKFWATKPPKAVAAVLAQQKGLFHQDEALQLDCTWDPSPVFRKGDWVVEIGHQGKVVPPSWCIGVNKAAAPSKQKVVTFVERYDAKLIPRTQFEAELLRRGFSLREDGSVRLEGLVEAIHECFGITPQLVYDATGEQPT